LDQEIIKIALKMVSRICATSHCSDCPLERNNHPFPPVKSICLLDKFEYTDEMIQYIDDWYHELFPRGELVLPKQINISAEDILEVFK